MKLARVGEVGREIPALIDADNIAYSLVGVIGDVDGSHLSPEVLAMLQKIDIKKLSIIEHPYRVGACVAAPSQVICVGLNYFEHAKESGMSVPSEPILFSKATSAIVGPNANCHPSWV